MGFKIKQYSLTNSSQSVTFSKVPKKLGIIIPERLWMANANNGEVIINMNTTSFALGDRAVTLIYETDDGSTYPQINDNDITTISLPQGFSFNVNWNDEDENNKNHYDYLGNSIKSILIDTVEEE